MQRAIVERDHVARLDSERNDLVLIAHKVDVRDELEAAGAGDEGGVVDELARHEPAAPTMRADNELDTCWARHGIE